MLAVLPKKDLDHCLPGEDGRWWDAGCSEWGRCSATRPTRHPEAREPDWRMMDWKFLIIEFSFWSPIVHVGQLVVSAHRHCEIGFCLNQNRSKHIGEGTPCPPLEVWSPLGGEHCPPSPPSGPPRPLPEVQTIQCCPFGSEAWSIHF